MSKLAITPEVAIDETELDERFIQASGPGGQNVNKVATAVQLRFDVANSPSLAPEIRQRLAALAGRRLTKDGVLVLIARQHRTQERNRADARARLVALIASAAVPPQERRVTRVPRSSKRKRRDDKRARGNVKRLRARPVED
jgi:ribosome-associated protein